MKKLPVDRTRTNAVFCDTFSPPAPTVCTAFSSGGKSTVKNAEKTRLAFPAFDPRPLEG
jgi:hypothetical protein